MVGHIHKGAGKDAFTVQHPVASLAQWEKEGMARGGRAAALAAAAAAAARDLHVQLAQRGRKDEEQHARRGGVPT